MKTKLQTLQQKLAQGFVGRDDIIKSVLLAMVAGENSLLIGPPGTGKSMVARRLSQAIKETQNTPYFEYLLTKFSAPEEIFGPLSISELKQDRFHRKTDGYLPTAQVAFLDEIFKASSSILNALLTILNERKFHNGTDTQHIPLQSLIGASNELPTGQTELAALYDRFLIRRFVGYVGDNELSQLFTLQSPQAIDITEQLTTDDIAQIQHTAKAVIVPSDVQQAIIKIWAALKEEFKENSDEQFSDRRFVKAVYLLKVSAATNGRSEVDFSDVLLLKDCLWNNPENITKIREIIKTTLAGFDQAISTDTPQYLTDTVFAKVEVPSQNIIKGMQGAGSKDDPILIETAQHLQRLEDPRIGQQGYYFKQIQDIDCSSIGQESWFNIDFKGHYDGNNKEILYTNGDKSLFKCATDSTFKNIVLNNLALAGSIKNCTVYACRSTGTLLGYTTDYDDRTNSQDSHLRHCHAGKYLAWNISNTTLEQCTSHSVLIRNRALNHSKIINCMVDLNESIYDYYNDMKYCGGIVTNLVESTIHSCYVIGTFKRQNTSFDHLRYSGIANYINSSSIEYCMVGHLLPSNDISLQRRICRNYNNSSLQQNASIDTNNHDTGWSVNDTTPNGLDGANISPALFTQDYFEHTLGWDFDTVWQWNSQRNEPELQPSKSITSPTQDAYASDNTSSLLATQLKSNIWL